MSITHSVDDGLYRRPFIIKNAGIYRNGWDQMSIAIELVESLERNHGSGCRAHLAVTTDNIRALFDLMRPQIDTTTADGGYLSDFLTGHVVMGVFTSASGTAVALEDILGNNPCPVIIDKTAWACAHPTEPKED